jgi:type I restriction enzyme, S subunit
MRQVRYSGYKTTKSPWLASIPEHWEEKRLKDVATYNDESLEEKTDPDFELEYVDISSVSLTHGIEKTELLAFEKAPSRARRKVRHGDVIVSTVRTYLKAIAPIKNPPLNMVVSTGFAVIRPRPSLDARFAGYMLQSDGFVGDVVANSVGVSYPAINASDLARLPFAEPPLSEQRKVSDFLDHKTAQIDVLIAKKQTLLAKLAEQRSSLINQAVTKGLNDAVPMKESGFAWLGEIPRHWETKRLRFLMTMSGGLTPRTSEPRYWGGYIPWVSPKDMKSERLSSSIDTLTEDALNETTLRLYPSGKVLIVVRGMILAHTFPVAINEVPMTVNQDMKVLETTMNPKYLAVLLRGIQSLVLSIVEESAHGTKVLRTDLLKDIVLPVPPRMEQDEIVSEVARISTRIDKMVSTVTVAITKLQEYRSALITNAVTGKIDVRDFCIPTTTVQKEVAHG